MDGKISIQVESGINFNLHDLGKANNSTILYYPTKYPGQCIVLDYLDNVQTKCTVKLLQSTFEKLNYQFRCHRNLNDSQTFKLLSQVGDESSIDSLFLVILTTSYREVIECKHGKTRIKPEILVNKLNGRNCKSLAGKPKILVIQELRNKQLTSDSGNEQQTKRHHIPTHADMLIYTFRGDSPIFPQTLCATLLENSSQVNSVDLVSQLTMVTNAVHQQTGIVPEMFSTLIKLIRMSK